jgi:hypothetical protein
MHTSGSMLGQKLGAVQVIYRLVETGMLAIQNDQ